MNEQNGAPEDDGWEAEPDVAGWFAEACAPDIDRLLTPFFQDRARSTWELWGTLGGQVSEPDEDTKRRDKTQSTARAQAEKQATVDRLSKGMGDLFSELHQISDDPAEFFDMLATHARLHRRRGRPRGSTNPELDARILAAGDAAPEGRKQADVAAAAGAKTTQQVDAAYRKYLRLVAEREREQKAFEEWFPSSGTVDK